MAARVLHELGICLQVDQFEWKHPVLSLQVLGTIMVDAGSRAASVTIHRVMDVGHGLGNVSDIVRTDPEGAFRDQGFRRGLAAKSTRHDIDRGDASWKTGVLGKTLIQSNSQEFVWLGELLTMSRLKKSLMHALQLTMTYIETAWQLLLGKTPTDKTACEDPDLAQCSVELVDEAAKQRLLVKEASYMAYIKEEIHQDRPWRHWAAGEWNWYWRSGKHKGSRLKGGVFSSAGMCVDSRTRNDH